MRRSRSSSAGLRGIGFQTVFSNHHIFFKTILIWEDASPSSAGSFCS